MKKNLVMLLLFMSVVAVFAKTISINPSDDMYSDPNHEGITPVITELWTANFPNTGHFERIMMRFNLNELRAVDVNSATLHLTRFYSCPSGGTTATKFYAISEDWTEETWNPAVHIAYFQDINMNYVFTGTGGNAVVHFEIDITDLVNRWTSGEIENHGFVIVANQNQKFSKFYSKEHPNDSYRPKLTIDYTQTDNEDICDPPLPLSLSNHPNPFNPETTISMYLPEAGDVRMRILDIRGQVVYDIKVNGASKGYHNYVWNSRDSAGNQLSSGVYFCRLETKAGVVTKKMILQK
jgi:hypothetical protein